MNSQADELASAQDSEALADRYSAVRSATVALCASLETEDYVVQSMPDVSPTKWHLAHTTWFFEHFVLAASAPGYREFDSRFGYLFNSYYHTVGQMHLRPRRGLLTRPTVAEVREFRRYVDEHVMRLLDNDGDNEAIATLVTLGINHEQQHQELILTDIKHVFSCNPLHPALRDTPVANGKSAPPLRFVAGNSGIQEIGHAGDGFCFDNETPRHRTLIHPHALASRLVTNGEYRDFVRDGGYGQCELWLSDGWATVQQEGWDRPLYWDEYLEEHYTLGGHREIDPDAPVCHLSFYEADAYARWAGARLPSEAELELAARGSAPSGNFVEDGFLHPAAATDTDGRSQIYGDCWEWTQSSYAPYPGFRPLAGSLGEYNGKFMCNQMVLRGGSCATPASHIRASYRNFFYPHQRWQFSGVRLARDV